MLSAVRVVFNVDSFEVINIVGIDKDGSFIGEIRNDFFELFNSHRCKFLSYDYD